MANNMSGFFLKHGVVWVCRNAGKILITMIKTSKTSPYISARLTGLLDLHTDGLTVADKRRVSRWMRRWSWVARKSAIKFPISVDNWLASSVLHFLRSSFRLVSKDLTRGVIWWTTKWPDGYRYVCSTKQCKLCRNEL